MKTHGFLSIIFGIILLTLSTGHSQNLITDGDFSITTEVPKDFDGPPPENTWRTWQDHNVNATVSIVNQQVHYEIHSSGNQTYAIQLLQTGFSLEPGHSYRLSFDIKADADRTFYVFLGENWGNWTSHLRPGDNPQNATTEWRNINIEFDVYTVFPEHKLSFDFGTINTNVYLDNVSLIDLGAIKETTFAASSALNEDMSHPGFRPESALDRVFIDSYRVSEFIMYPTITRSIDTTTWSKPLSEAFAQHIMNEQNLNIRLSSEKLDPGELMGRSQFEFFQCDMVRLGIGIREHRENTDYYIIPEILFEPQRNETLFVFGIHVYILNNEGENVFSFLLNSHHELFLNAKLFAYKPYESEVEAMKQRALMAAAQAFQIMIKQTKAELN